MSNLINIIIHLYGLHATSIKSIYACIYLNKKRIYATNIIYSPIVANINILNVKFQTEYR